MQKIPRFIAPLLLVGLFFIAGYIYSGLTYIPPHFHANFSIYKDGQKLDFSGEEYMEDVAGCSLTGLLYPKNRVHLHNGDGYTVHVHAAGVSWEHFLSNIGFTFGPEFIYSTGSGMEAITGEKEISYILNGEKVDFPLKELITSEDTLLINIGNEDEKTLSQRYTDIPKEAVEYNGKYDPGSCGGNNDNAILVLLKDLFSFAGHTH